MTPSDPSKPSPLGDIPKAESSETSSKGLQEGGGSFYGLDAALRDIHKVALGPFDPSALNASPQDIVFMRQMTLREHYAGLVLQAFLSRDYQWADIDVLPGRAVQYADALIAALESK